MPDPRHGYGVSGRMLKLGARCGLGEEGLGVRTTREVATCEGQPCLAIVVLVLGLSIATASRVAASSLEVLGI